jgi:UrcA family protein
VRNIVAHIGCGLGLIGWSQSAVPAQQEEATMKNAFTIALASALITTAAIKAAPALAEAPAIETNVSLVRTADLDLNSSQGRRILNLRLARAAREVCGTASDVDLNGKNEVRHCRDEVLAQARANRDAVLAGSAGQGFIAVTAAR